MTSAAPSLARERRTLFGIPCVRYACSCGHKTDWFGFGGARDPYEQMAGHLADEHGDELKVGRCAECGRPTDHFRAESPFGDVYACEAHSPAMRERE